MSSDAVLALLTVCHKGYAGLKSKVSANDTRYIVRNTHHSCDASATAAPQPANDLPSDHWS